MFCHVESAHPAQFLPLHALAQRRRGHVRDLPRAAAGRGVRWRLSLARIDRPGPFSEFRGYRRAIALVSGDGCVLNGAAETPIRLERPGALATFAGEAAVDCELLGGPCHDLNLMVRTSIPILATRHLVTEADLDSFRVDGACVALFCLEGDDSTASASTTR